MDKPQELKITLNPISDVFGANKIERTARPITPFIARGGNLHYLYIRHNTARRIGNLATFMRCFSPNMYAVYDWFRKYTNTAEVWDLSHLQRDLLVAF